MKVWKVLGKIILICIPLILIWVFLAVFPVCYMDGEYSYFQWAKNVCTGEESVPQADILILGDSRAKSALVPELLSENAISLSEGGSTAVEAYYTLKNYLEYVGTPDKVILSISSYHFTSFDGFWTRSIYFDFLNTAQGAEVIRTTNAFEEGHALKEAGGDSILTLLEYKIKSPTKYIAPLVNSIGENRRQINEEAYAEMQASRGFKSFVSWWPTSAEHDMEEFRLLETLDYYYRKTIDLCVENGIEVYSVNTPLIATTFDESEKIWQPFSEYFVQLKADYELAGVPGVIIETDFDAYDETYFDDADHLNPAGAEVYTKQFISKYMKQVRYTGKEDGKEAA